MTTVLEDTQAVTAIVSGKLSARATQGSRIAAMSYLPNRANQRVRVLAFIYDAGDDGVITDDLVNALGLKRKSAYPRRLELAEMGLIRDSGRRVKTRGVDAVVWTCTERGVRVVEKGLSNDAVRVPKDVRERLEQRGVARTLVEGEYLLLPAFTHDALLDAVALGHELRDSGSDAETATRWLLENPKAVSALVAEAEDQMIMDCAIALSRSLDEVMAKAAS